MYTFRSIIKESIWVLFGAAILSSLGGLALRSAQEKILLIAPLIILLPALNGLVGHFGIIVVSKFTTALYLHKIGKEKWYHSFAITHLIREIIPLSLLAAVYIVFLASLISYLRGYPLTQLLVIKILGLTLITTLVLTLLNLTIGILGGLYLYHKKKDPDDVLIPITTAIADLGSMSILSILVTSFF